MIYLNDPARPMKTKRNIFFTHFFIAILLLGLTSACGSDDPERQARRDRDKIIDYLKKNNLFEAAQELESGVFYIIEQEGVGDFPSQTSTVIINYKGRLLSGKEFGDVNGATLNLNGTILGFKYGIPMFNRGSKGQLFIPSGLAYGPTGSFTIPPNAVLIYDIEMIDFN